MKLILKLPLKVIVVCLLCLTVSGCFLQILIGTAAKVGSSLITTIETDSILATCVNGSGGFNNVECTYFFLDAQGVPVSVTSTADLTAELGIVGLIVDPLILQVPQDIRVRSATFESGTGPQNLDVTVTGAFPVDAATIVEAEPGQKFIIFEFPDSLGPMIPPGDASTGLPVGITVELLRTRTPDLLDEPFTFKGLFTIPFEVLNTTYYVPMLPCTTDLSQIPAFEVDPATGTLDLQDSLSALLLNSPVCNNRRYDFINLGAQVLASVGQLEFGPLTLGETRNLTVALSNVGPGQLTINNVQAPASTEFTVLQDNCTGNQFSSSTGCEIEVAFSPASAADSVGTLVVSSNDLNRPSLQIPLAGSGTSSAAVGSASCSAADFGLVGDGATSTLRRTIWNSGEANLNISSVALADTTHFTLVSDDCTGAVLPPTFGCGVEVGYQPQATGAHSTMLTVSSSNSSSNLSAVVSGTSNADIGFKNSFESACGP